MVTSFSSAVAVLVPAIRAAISSAANAFARVNRYVNVVDFVVVLFTITFLWPFNRPVCCIVCSRLLVVFGSVCCYTKPSRTVTGFLIDQVMGLMSAPIRSFCRLTGAAETDAAFQSPGVRR